MSHRYEFRDVTGISILLRSLHWRGTYAGAAEGTPEMLTKLILPKLRSAPGRLVMGLATTTGEPVRELPDERCVAELWSTWSRPDPDEDALGSVLELEWFQSGGDPFVRCGELVSTLDWAAHAADWVP